MLGTQITIGLSEDIYCFLLVRFACCTNNVGKPEFMTPVDILAILGQHITCMHSFWCRCMCLVRVAVSHGYAGPPSAPPHLIPALLPPTTTIIKRRGVWGVVDLGAASPLYRLLVRDTQCGNHQPGQTFSIRCPVGVVKKALSTYHCK